jgi:copper chaperone CopZ
MTDLQAKNVNKFNIEYNVEGMHCAACELLIESKFFKKHGVEKVKASLGKGKVYLQVKTKFSKEELRKKLSKLI